MMSETSFLKRTLSVSFSFPCQLLYGNVFFENIVYINERLRKDKRTYRYTDSIIEERIISSLSCIWVKIMILMK